MIWIAVGAVGFIVLCMGVFVFGLCKAAGKEPPGPGERS